MKETRFILICLISLLLSGCAANPTGAGQTLPPPPLEAPPTSTAAMPPPPAEPPAAQTETPLPPTDLPPSPTAQVESGGAVDSACLQDPNNPIARSIAQEYPHTSYEQVMYWYCSGALFEDILTALQTEELLPAEEDATAQDMLAWLAQGLTWNEIWQVLNLTK